MIFLSWLIFDLGVTGGFLPQSDSSGPAGGGIRLVTLPLRFGPFIPAHFALAIGKHFGSDADGNID
jgi:hypothetical protein